MFFFLKSCQEIKHTKGIFYGHYVAVNQSLFCRRLRFTCPVSLQTRKKTKKENREANKEIVSDVIRHCALEDRQRWVSSEKIEFVYIIAGKYPDQHVLWVRVSITKLKLEVRIQHSWEATSAHLLWAESIALCFKDRGVTGMMEENSSDQPSPKETGIKFRRYRKSY